MPTPVTSTKIKMLLPVKLQPPELLSVARKMGEAITERDVVDAQKKATLKQYTERLAGINSRITSLNLTLSTETENREVECERVKDLDAKEMRIIRLDTGEVHERRPLSNLELQTEIPGTAPTVHYGESAGSRSDRRAEAEEPDEIQQEASTPEEAETLRAGRVRVRSASEEEPPFADEEPHGFDDGDPDEDSAAARKANGEPSGWAHALGPKDRWR